MILGRREGGAGGVVMASEQPKVSRETFYAAKITVRVPCSSRAKSLKRNGAQGRNRTSDTVIFSHVLYQLSYLGMASGGLAGAEARPL